MKCDERVPTLKQLIAELDAQSRFLKAAPKSVRDATWQRRKAQVQRRIRACRLAVAYLEGRRYGQLEAWNGTSYGSPPPLSEVLQVLKYGPLPSGLGPILRAWVIQSVAQRQIPWHFASFLTWYEKDLRGSA